MYFGDHISKLDFFLSVRLKMDWIGKNDVRCLTSEQVLHGRAEEVELPEGVQVSQWSPSR